MTTLHYNFNNITSISTDLYYRIWNCEGSLWDEENSDLLEELCLEVGEDVYEINETLS